ncbi:LysR family transcriptional regulator [Desertivirga brevis]|uniref:LysR family transcriptional regulator n=1 Tax=Desertivirga brevis TaxID=2810310 RepID=UPI001A959291|nr:LysR substrate-binding domain-containing protein [Pedobacter sp. SYSU D00873]
MELRHLLYFQTVAEELHFRKAAEKLFISQPPLSRQIRELEEELEVSLFKRNNKRVVLTEAGKYFKTEVDEIFAKIAASRHRLKEIEGSVTGQLRIGFISSVNQQQLIAVLKDIKIRFPYVKTRLYELPTIKQVKALEEDKLDVGIMRAPIKSERLEVKTLFNEPFVFVFPQGEIDHLNIESIQKYMTGRPFVFFNKDYAPEYFHKLEEICQRLGFYPEVTHEVNNVHSIMQLVEKGLGVSIVPSSLKNSFDHLNLSFINLNHLPITTEVVLALKPGNQHPATRWFIEKFPMKASPVYGQVDTEAGTFP